MRLFGSAIFTLAMVLSSTVLSASFDQFKQAIDSNNIARLNVLTRNIDDVNTARFNGKSLMEMAIESNSKDSAQFLIKKGYNQSSLTSAWPVAVGHLNRTQLLLSLGASADSRIRGIPVLHLAAEKGNSAVVKQLIEAGADVNAKTSKGASAIIAAAQAPKNQRKSILNLLSANGMDFQGTNDKGQTALHQYAIAANQKGVSAMLKAGIDPKAKDQHGRTYIDYLLASNNGQRIIKNLGISNISIDQKITATQLAAAENQTLALRQLLVDTKGQHAVSLNSDFLKRKYWNTSYILNQYASITSDELLQGKSYYDLILEDFDTGYFLIGLGHVPSLNSLEEVSKAIPLCNERDLMPMLKSAGLETEHLIEGDSHHSIYNFLLQNCSVEQSFFISYEDAASIAAESFVTDAGITELYILGNWQTQDKKNVYLFEESGQFTQLYKSVGGYKTAKGTWKPTSAGVEIKFNNNTHFFLVSSLGETMATGQFGPWYSEIYRQ